MPFKETMMEKAGPLPIWGWLVIGGVGVYVVYRWRANQAASSSSTDTSNPQQVSAQDLTAGQIAADYDLYNELGITSSGLATLATNVGAQTTATQAQTTATNANTGAVQGNTTATNTNTSAVNSTNSATNANTAATNTNTTAVNSNTKAVTTTSKAITPASAVDEYIVYYDSATKQYYDVNPTKKTVHHLTADQLAADKKAGATIKTVKGTPKYSSGGVLQFV